MFLIVVGVIGVAAYLTKPSLKDAKSLYEKQNDSISRTLRKAIVDGGDLNPLLDGLLSMGMSELAGIELKLYQKDFIVYKEFYLVIHQKKQNRNHQVLFAVGAFTQLIEKEIRLEEFVEIYNITSFDGSVDLNL